MRLFSKHRGRLVTTLSHFSGPALALFSALLFGLSPALAKVFVGEISPPFLAGLLYLGSGVGLAGFLILKSKPLLEELRRLSGREQVKVSGAVFAGGVLAPSALLTV